MKKHINLNTILILVVGVLVSATGWFTKEEIAENRKSREAVAGLNVTVAKLETAFNDIRDQISKLVTFSEFKAALTERDTEIQELKKELRDLRGRLLRPGAPTPPKVPN